MNSKANKIIFACSCAGIVCLLALALFPSFRNQIIVLAEKFVFKRMLAHPDKAARFIFDNAIAGIAAIIAVDFSILILADKKHAVYGIVFSAVFIAVMLFFWMCVNYAFVNNSDCSSFLVLAKHLAESNRLLSADIYYGNWLPVFEPITLFYAPLFKIFSRWALVRTIGKLLVWLAEMAAYAFMARQLRIKWNIILFTSAFFLLPIGFENAYQYMIITQYNLYFVLCFLNIGFYLYLKNHSNHFIYMVILSLCAFFAGLSGIRLVLVFFVPFLIVIFYGIAKNPIQNKADMFFYNNNHIFKEPLTALKRPGILACLFFVLGYMILSTILTLRYSFKHYGTEYFLAGPNDFVDHAGKLFMGLLELFGFTFDVPVLSLSGLCNITAFLFLSLLVIKIKNYFKNSDNPEKTFFIRFICASFFFNTVVFEFSVISFFRNDFVSRYYIPITVFFIPLCALVLNDGFRPFFSKLTLFLLVFHVFVSSANTIPDYVRSLQTSTQTKTPVAEFLKDNNYRLGLATFWNSAVIEEITDGKVQFATVDFSNGENPPIRFYRYFTLKEYERRMYDADFILVSKKEYETYKNNIYFKDRELTYEDQWYVVLKL